MKNAIRTAAGLAMAGALVLLGIWIGRTVEPSRVLSAWRVDGVAAARPAAEAHAAGGEKKPLYYRNPMGLPDKSPVPKKDSMGMDYIPVFEEDASGPANAVRVSLDKVQRAGVRTEPAARRQLRRDIRGTGTVVPNERTLAVVTVKFPGFIESLAVPVTGAEVRAGDLLMRVWAESPELLRKQVDLILAMRGATASDGQRISVEAAERNLRLFDFPQGAIDQVKRTGEPQRSFPWVAPVGGTVIEKPAMVGMRFQAGDPLYRLADLSTVWLMAELAERDLGLVKPGQRATLNFRSQTNAHATGRVEFVYPDINMATRTGRVRIQLANPDRAIRLGAFADATIEATATNGPVLAVPDSAVIDSGLRRVVMVARGEGMFESRAVTLGERGGGYVEIREGIAEGESVVVRGNFLIDAESNLRAALATLTAPSEPK
jgi:Cu(I)/Ag(I) efflux system membrane fusion protein